MTTTEKDLAKAIHIASVQSESKALLEKVISDLNSLKHQTYSEDLRKDINIAMDVLEKHKEAFSFYNIRESILQELLDK